MTGATSTTGGGGGAAARTFPLPQPSAFSRSTALTRAVDICFIFFPSIELLNFCFNRVTGAPESGRCSVGGKCGPRVVLSIQARQSRDCTLLQRQIAYQNGHEAKYRQLKEVFRRCSTRTVEGVESVEKADSRQPDSHRS